MDRALLAQMLSATTTKPEEDFRQSFLREMQPDEKATRDADRRRGIDDSVPLADATALGKAAMHSDMQGNQDAFQSALRAYILRRQGGAENLPSAGQRPKFSGHSIF